MNFFGHAAVMGGPIDLIVTPPVARLNRFVSASGAVVSLYYVTLFYVVAAWGSADFCSVSAMSSSTP